MFSMVNECMCVCIYLFYTLFFVLSVVFLLFSSQVVGVSDDEEEVEVKRRTVSGCYVAFLYYRSTVYGM